MGSRALARRGDIGTNAMSAACAALLRAITNPCLPVVYYSTVVEVDRFPYAHVKNVFVVNAHPDWVIYCRLKGSQSNSILCAWDVWEF